MLELTNADGASQTITTDATLRVSSQNRLGPSGTLGQVSPTTWTPAATFDDTACQKTIAVDFTETREQPSRYRRRIGPQTLLDSSSIDH